MNRTKDRMLTGGLALGGAARLARTSEIVPAFKTAGLDWLFLDLEHGPHSIDTASQLAMMALEAGLTPIARVPAGEFGMATRLLDNGALGLIMPHVDSPDQARSMVERLRFPPLGTRSVFGGMPHFGFEARGIAETSSVLNRETLIVAMLETPTAISNAADIAAIPGIDVLFIGANDLCAEMGIPGEFNHPDFASAVQQTIEACRRSEKWAGVGGMYDRTLLGKFIAAGLQFILVGSDLSFLISAARQAVSGLRQEENPQAIQGRG